MSGIEALAAFGIACNVMQVISFAHNAVHIGKAIYETGSLDPTLAQTTHCLAQGLERLKTSLENQPPLCAEEQELLDIANGCIVTVANLKIKLDKIASSVAKRNRPAAFRGWLKLTFGGKKAIEKFEKELSNYQRVLENRLLLLIWHVACLGQTLVTQSLTCK